jgi:ribosomal protein RSM22 (predicted rRNA methylase)
VSAGLPDALQDAIALFTDGVPPKELAARAASLSERYRGGSGSHTAIADDRDVAAYLTTRLPATYAAMAAVLDAVKERAPTFTPAHLLDAGAGPGTASWAATEFWPQLRSITMLDRNPHLLAAARTLAHASPHTALSSAAFISSDLGATKTSLPSPLVGDRGPISDSGAVAGPSVGALRSSARPTEGGAASTRLKASEHAASYDLILAGYTFAEVPEQTRDRVLATLWNACGGVLVIVEPGTPAGFATILACRTALLALGARIIAPCAGAHACPIVAPDWCHFAERLPRSRAHMRAKDATVPFEDEKFSYVAVAREGIEIAPIEARILAVPHTTKPGTRLKLCTLSGLADRIVLKRDKPAYKAVSRKGWGDSL